MAWLTNLGPSVGPVTVVTSTAAGVWFVVRLVLRFQKDFTDRYAAEVHALDEVLAKLRKERSTMEGRIETLIRALRAHGIEVPDDDP